MKWDKNIEVEWNVPNFLEVLGDEYSKEFAMAEFSSIKSGSHFSSGVGRSKENYIKRIEAIGFINKTKILDAGCGMGQWSCVLSLYNQEVFGIDQSEHRLNIAKYLNRDRKNISFCRGDLEKLPFEEEYFEAIFCYGVFMFTDMVKTIENFKKVLTKDGVIFLNINNIGHYIDRIIYHTNISPNKELVEQFMRMINNYYNGNYKSSLMTLEKLEVLLNDVGMEIVYSGYDGESANLPFYKTSYLGFPYLSEVLIRNKGV